MTLIEVVDWPPSNDVKSTKSCRLARKNTPSGAVRCEYYGFDNLARRDLGDDFVDVNNFTLAEDDRRRSNFCGSSWVDANTKCGQWCPNEDDNECDSGEMCHVETYCKYQVDLSSSSPAMDNNSLSFVTLSPANDFATPTQQPPNSYQPSIENAIPPNRVENSTQAITNDDEDWSHVAQGDEIQNLWCGTSQFDAIRNCGTGTRCDNGVCPDGLQCFMVSSLCHAEDNNEVDVASTVTASTLASILSNSTNKGDTPAPSPAQYPASPSNSSLIPSTDHLINGTINPVSSSAPSSVPALNESQTDVSDTFFCGYDLEDASTTCHLRCRSGSPGECPSGETCFGYTSCTGESPRPPPTQKPTQPPTSEPTTVSNLTEFRGLCAVDYDILQQTCWTAVECNNTHPCPQNETCFENVDCSLTTGSGVSLFPSTSPVPTLGNAFNTSANTQSSVPTQTELDLIPSPAPVTVNPTPSVNTIKDSPSPISSEPQLLCAFSMDELKVSCASAQSCNQGPCPSGMFCFPFSCEPSGSEEHIVSDGKTYYCAQNAAELELSCGILTKCNNGLPPCPKDKSCLEYDCKQIIELCPLNYVGWQSNRECSEYYECKNGIAGKPSFCSAGLKFDKLRGECYEDSTINEYCYGPPVQKATRSPTGPPLNLCPKEFIGWHSSSDCKEYYKCDDGSAGAIRVCNEGLKFDKVRNECVSESLVNEFCYGPPLDNGNQQLNEDTKPENDLVMDSENPPTELDACLNGYTGWEASSDCTQYYWCDEGVPATRYACGDGLLFKSESEICTFADEVDCVNENTMKTPNLSPSLGPMITPAKGVIDTSFPTLGRDKPWTITPTISKSGSADPPWLSFERKESNSANFVRALSRFRLLQLLLL
ncbi:hypothetical protein HJC23_004883 [Cyclotella cryptica]|uniref:Chitin-binding type-2 domain-containing protein n=1 Tax=Cyclotella cryptica TaxID=29204 RepID=A0ABD3P3N3_9STRA